MKLMRIGPVGAERPCVLDRNGKARDLSRIISDFGPQTLSPALVKKLEEYDLSTLPEIDLAGERIGAPMSRPGTIFCIGLNYSDHAKEAGMAIPEEPIVFSKAAGTYSGPFDPVLYGEGMSKLDWEVELGIVIARAALNVSEAEAIDYILGYTIVNDVSERAWQLERGGQWIKGKSFPSFCPVGPYLVTTGEVTDPQALELTLDVNGERMQSGSTSQMIFPVAHIVSYLSQFALLEPGDLICTGTPPGVGVGMTPPRFLKVNDIIELSISQLGSQKQKVIPVDQTLISSFLSHCR